MTAEAIARVVADLQAGRCQPACEYLSIDGGPSTVFDYGLRLAAQTTTIVDISQMYESQRQVSGGYDPYEEFACVAPPFEKAMFGFVNQFHNAIVINTTASENVKPWETSNEVEWDRVRWEILGLTWVGGASTGTGERNLPTRGPFVGWQIAVYPDGALADLHWNLLYPDIPADQWMLTSLSLVSALNFLNCRNVEVVEPNRPRAERRRLERIGVGPVGELVVTPVGRRTAGSRPASGAGVPLSSVRGHMAHYGACCPTHPPRGRLFGRLEGRYWIPQHARGNAELGTRQPSYRLEPDRVGEAAAAYPERHARGA